MYHRIVDIDFDPRRLSVSPKHFEEQMQIIKKYCQPLQMREMADNLKRFSFGNKEIVVTFDDGYSDNFSNARPILEQYGIPATFFIVTGAINSREEFYGNYLERCILSPKTLPEALEIMVSGIKYEWKINSEPPCQAADYSKYRMMVPENSIKLSRCELYFALNQLLNTISLQERKDILSKISNWANLSLTPMQNSLPMTSEELVSLAGSRLFEIGAHTVTHAMLSRLSSKEQEKEVVHSKNDLEGMLKHEVTSFSYPYGNYSNDALKLLKRLKFKAACTVIHQPVIRNTNPHLLPRYAALNWSGNEFEQSLHKWLT